MRKNTHLRDQSRRPQKGHEMPIREIFGKCETTVRVAVVFAILDVGSVELVQPVQDFLDVLIF